MSRWSKWTKVLCYNFDNTRNRFFNSMLILLVSCFFSAELPHLRSKKWPIAGALFTHIFFERETRSRNRNGYVGETRLYKNVHKNRVFYFTFAFLNTVIDLVSTMGRQSEGQEIWKLNIIYILWDNCSRIFHSVIVAIISVAIGRLIHPNQQTF